MRIDEALKSASERLSAAGVTDPRRAAASLAALALDKPNSFLIAHPEYELTIDESALFDSYVGRREKREPFQYIAGRQEFYGLDFEVTPAVLIPRPETEIMVEEAIKELQRLENPRFCEVGIGSGCISISILKNVPSATAVATDISAQAIEVAYRNADHHGVADRLKMIEGDLFAGVDGVFDMIVSNPPYIPTGDLQTLQPEVRGFEPPSALFAGEYGTDVITRIIHQAWQRLAPSGTLLIEFGFGQSGQLNEVAEQGEWRALRFLNDLQGIPRVLSLRRNEEG